MPGARYRTATALSAGASNFTNGAINRHNGIGGTIRMAVKKREGCASKNKDGGGGGGGGVEKENSTKGSDEKCVCERAGEGGREGKMVAHSLFLCHKLSWAFACSVFDLSVI